MDIFNTNTEIFLKIIFFLFTSLLFYDISPISYLITSRYFPYFLPRLFLFFFSIIMLILIFKSLNLIIVICEI